MKGTGKKEDNPKASIVIITKNQKSFLEKSLPMIFQQTFQDFEVILVDSGSSDGALEWAQSFPIKIVHLAAEKFSYAKAANLGIANSNGGIVVRLSGDAIPAGRFWLEKLTAPFKDLLVGATYGNQIGKGKNICEIFGWYFYMGKKKRILTEARWNTLGALGGPNMALRRFLWEIVPFDESLPYAEIGVWAKSLFQLGYKIVYVPGAKVYHVHGYKSYDFGGRQRTFFKRHILEWAWGTVLSIGRILKSLVKRP